METEYDADAPKVINTTGLDDQVVGAAIESIKARLTPYQTNSKTSDSLRMQATINGQPSSTRSELFVQCEKASMNDVIAGIIDSTTGLAFEGIKWESIEPDAAEVMNIISSDINLDKIVRAAHRELFIYDQVIFASTWTEKTIQMKSRMAPKRAPLEKVDLGDGTETWRPMRGEDGYFIEPEYPGVPRRQEYLVRAPRDIFTLDPKKVAVIANFHSEDLFWRANDLEYKRYKTHPVLRKLIDRPATQEEKELIIAESGYADYSSSFLKLNSENVWRHTSPKSNWETYPPSRLASVFPLISLREKMMDSDGAALAGNANYILLVRVGDKDDPAEQAEISAIRKAMSNVGSVPLIVGDHRLQVDILTPNIDNTLDAERYSTIDSRIISRLLGSIKIGAAGNGRKSDTSTSTMVSRFLESQRHMLKRTLEERIMERVLGSNPKLKDGARLTFLPNKIAIDKPDELYTSILGLHDRGNLSRQTTLESFGFSQEEELNRRVREKVNGFDDVFKTSLPYTSPDIQPFGNDSDSDGDED